MQQISLGIHEKIKIRAGIKGILFICWFGYALNGFAV
jgi:hypothetical protein